MAEGQINTRSNIYISNGMLSTHFHGVLPHQGVSKNFTQVTHVLKHINLVTILKPVIFTIGQSQFKTPPRQAFNEFELKIIFIQICFCKVEDGDSVATSHCFTPHGSGHAILSNLSNKNLLYLFMHIQVIYHYY